ncbi:uncharacterized protein B0I36DRAFT_88147 [Microdochium trichocladiopsis]|uniref:Uncharacterized protein n=1 Tax=Microdochium trichocladiopsis TaxID=1682393 RepID=A0A9P8YB23_9PEZI|nr:uncharacterized protein B0I36DRAFT_88147 [Microdochium trichocladiopsis]KAH7035106.1 hypothetical protein B0I36DRAFT_88147 [Microdochium trichocladiopsis]
MLSCCCPWVRGPPEVCKWFGMKGPERRRGGDLNPRGRGEHSICTPYRNNHHQFGPWLAKLAPSNSVVLHNGRGVGRGGHAMPRFSAVEPWLMLQDLRHRTILVPGRTLVHPLCASRVLAFPPSDHCLSSMPFVARASLQLDQFRAASRPQDQPRR